MLHPNFRPRGEVLQHREDLLNAGTQFCDSVQKIIWQVFDEQRTIFAAKETHHPVFDALTDPWVAHKFYEFDCFVHPSLTRGTAVGLPGARFIDYQPVATMVHLLGRKLRFSEQQSRFPNIFLSASVTADPPEDTTVIVYRGESWFDIGLVGDEGGEATIGGIAICGFMAADSDAIVCSRRVELKGTNAARVSDRTVGAKLTGPVVVVRLYKGAGEVEDKVALVTSTPASGDYREFLKGLFGVVLGASMSFLAQFYFNIRDHRDRVRKERHLYQGTALLAVNTLYVRAREVAGEAKREAGTRNVSAIDPSRAFELLKAADTMSAVNAECYAEYQNDLDEFLNSTLDYVSGSIGIDQFLKCKAAVLKRLATSPPRTG